MSKVFLDTSFLLAYVNSNDELHENALRAGKLKTSYQRTVTSITMY